MEVRRGRGSFTICEILHEPALLLFETGVQVCTISCFKSPVEWNKPEERIISNVVEQPANVGG
jgi:hypothetical protein